jgi:hypothetical protein
MCRYSDFSMFFGSDGALAIQLLTVASIASSIVLWVYIYRGQKIGLAQYAIPIILWIVSGTLDITVTAKGTYNAPTNEGNPLARFIFVETGFLGPVVASVLWISLWSLLVLAINKKVKAPLAQYLSLAVFYSLGIGHIFGFSSWFDPLCDISRASWLLLPDWHLRFVGIVLLGCAVAGVHRAIIAVVSSWKGAGPVKGRSP